MFDLSLIDNQYRKFTGNIHEFLQDGIADVDLELLHHFDLLHYHPSAQEYRPLTRYFQVIETVDKITLINDVFVIWIVPDRNKHSSVTYTLIALNNPDPNLITMEAAFTTWGIYNTSSLVLRVLEKYLAEIQENEAILSSLKGERPGA